jgi:hypothetical protein
MKKQLNPGILRLGLEAFILIKFPEAAFPDNFDIISASSMYNDVKNRKFKTMV